MSQSRIDAFVASKEDWIAKKLAESRKALALKEAFALSYGDTVLYRGKHYPIIAKAGRSIGFDGTQFYAPPDLTPEQIQQACVQLYRKMAKQVLAQKVSYYAKQLSVSPKAIRITSARTRWGSCSAKKNLNFSWRLIMAHDEVIDYVVVHELAHLIEMNHSERFWKTVSSIFPEYKEQKAQLKALQKRLNTENW